MKAMKALVLYDSFFGNTEKIAQAISAALGEQVICEDDGRMRLCS